MYAITNPLDILPYRLQKRFMDHQILKDPILSLPVTPEFRQMAKTNHFVTLQDILDSDLGQFHALPDSGYRILKELYDILKTYGLEHALNN